MRRTMCERGQVAELAQLQPTDGHESAVEHLAGALEDARRPEMAKLAFEVEQLGAG